MTTVGLLNPGDMGSKVGAAVRSAGSRVLWAGEGRSADTRKRAVEGGLEDVGSVAALVRASDVILSVCPPHAAVDVAKEVAGLRIPNVVQRKQLPLVVRVTVEIARHCPLLGVVTQLIAAEVVVVRLRVRGNVALH